MVTQMSMKRWSYEIILIGISEAGRQKPGRDGCLLRGIRASRNGNVEHGASTLHTFNRQRQANSPGSNALPLLARGRGGAQTEGGMDSLRESGNQFLALVIVNDQLLQARIRSDRKDHTLGHHGKIVNENCFLVLWIRQDETLRIQRTPFHQN